MKDSHVSDDQPGRLSGADMIAGFAARVLDVLVERSRRTGTTFRTDLVVALAEGMVTQDEALIERTLAAFRRACISPTAMVDVYVPAAARHLGDQWCCDGMNFAAVSIASARLQALARAIATRWGGDVAHVPGRKSVLMIVPKTETHTLGAVVAVGQLRRMGLSVCLRLSPSYAEVTGLMRARSFDAAMVSVGDEDHLNFSRNLIETLREAAPSRLPVVVGGSVLLRQIDVIARTGADFVTGDTAAAVEFCGLSHRVLPDRPADMWFSCKDSADATRLGSLANG